MKHPIDNIYAKKGKCFDIKLWTKGATHVRARESHFLIFFVDNNLDAELLICFDMLDRMCLD